MKKNYKFDGIPFEDYFIRKVPSSTGGLWIWGSNSDGQLGDNTVVDKSSPIQTVAGGTNWKSISGGDSHILAIKTDGTLWGWGLNNKGQLGDETIVHRSSPIQTVAGGTNWKSVSGSGNHTAAIKIDGTLWVWGENTDGQLGDDTDVDKSSPVQTVAGGTNWKTVSCGVASTFATKADGTLWGWGSNEYGQLGDGTIVNKSSPVQTVAGGTNWKSVNSGSYHTLGLKTDGTLWLWGHNASGQLGDETIVDKSSPVQTVAGGTNWKFVSGGIHHTAAIKIDDTLWIWGSNSDGQLGDDTDVDKSSPIQIIAENTSWKSVSCGAYYTVAIKTDGVRWSWKTKEFSQSGSDTLWGWGHNANGQLGDNTVINRSSPVQTIADSTNWWKSVSAGSGYTVAIKDN